MIMSHKADATRSTGLAQVVSETNIRLHVGMLVDTLVPSE